MIFTVAVPEQHQDKANQLAMALGLSLNDGKTYNELKYEDSEGNLYAVASFIAPDRILDKVSTTLERPAWDEENQAIDMEQAEQAKSLLSFDTVADINSISVKSDIKGLDAIDLMGLTRYSPEMEIEDELMMDELIMDELIGELHVGE